MEKNSLELRLKKAESKNKVYESIINTLLDWIMEIEEEDFAETVDQDSMIRLTGKGYSFRCTGGMDNPDDFCGCNVFKALKNDPSRYKCNACGTIWQSEK